MKTLMSIFVFILSATFIVAGCQNENKSKSRIKEGSRHKLGAGQQGKGSQTSDTANGADTIESCDDANGVDDNQTGANNSNEKLRPDVDLEGLDNPICNSQSPELCHAIRAIVANDGQIIGLDRQNIINQNEGYEAKESEVQKDSNGVSVSFERNASAINQGKSVRLILALSNPEIKNLLKDVAVENTKLEILNVDLNNAQGFMQQLARVATGTNTIVALPHRLYDVHGARLATLPVRTVTFDENAVDALGVENFLLQEVGDIVYLTYILPQQLETVDETSVQVDINDTQLAAGSFAISKTMDGLLRVQITDRGSLKNYSDSIRISYDLLDEQAAE